MLYFHHFVPFSLFLKKFFIIFWTVEHLYRYYFDYTYKFLILNLQSLWRYH